MSVTLTVKLAVPAAVGVPLSATVPAAASVVRSAAVRPVVPALKPGDVKSCRACCRPTP